VHRVDGCNDQNGSIAGAVPAVQLLQSPCNDIVKAKSGRMCSYHGRRMKPGVSLLHRAPGPWAIRRQIIVDVPETVRGLLTYSTWESDIPLKWPSHKSCRPINVLHVAAYHLPLTRLLRSTPLLK
jgi:hypothetical protein